MNNEEIIARAREMVGAPFLHQGRDRSGIDCVGLLAWSRAYGGELPAYPRDPVNGELELHLQRILGAPLAVKPPMDFVLLPGDILSIQFAGPTRHVALVGDYPTPGHVSMIHTSASVGKVVEHILDAKWRKRIVKVWRS